MYTTEEKAEIVQMYFYTGNNSLRTVRELFATKYPERPLPSVSTIHKIVRRYDTHGCLLPSHKDKSRARHVTTEELELEILCFVEENPVSSLTTISKHFNISRSSVRNVLKKYKYKIQRPKKKIIVRKSLNRISVNIPVECSISESFHREPEADIKEEPQEEQLQESFHLEAAMKQQPQEEEIPASFHLEVPIKQEPQEEEIPQRFHLEAAIKQEPQEDEQMEETFRPELVSIKEEPQEEQIQESFHPETAIKEEPQEEQIPKIFHLLIFRLP